MFVIALVGLIAIEIIFGNPYLNLLTFGVVFVVWCCAGAFISDYVFKHGLLYDVLGKTLCEIILSNDED